MKLNKSLPNAIYRNGKKLGYNRSFKTLPEARKFVVHLKERPYRQALTQIRKCRQFGDVEYAVYATYY